MANTTTKKTRAKKAKSKPRIGRTVADTARVLNDAAAFRAVRPTHRVSLGTGVVAMMVEPTLAELDGIDKAASAEGAGLEVGGIMAQMLIVNEAGQPVFDSVEQACDVLTIGQMAKVTAFLDRLKDVVSAEGN